MGASTRCSWVLLAAAVATSPVAPVFAATPSVDAARADAASARSELNRLVKRQHRLAREIDELKRSVRSSDVQLNRLLSRSVQLEAELRAADDARRSAEQAVQGAARARIGEIDRELTSRAPLLRRGPLPARRRQAQALRELSDERARLVEVLRRADSTAVHRWAEQRVEPDPLDGPSELREKADFIEDARDKLRAKQRLLASVVAAAERSRRLGDAATTFAAESRLFDEETRPGRVLRGNDSGTRLASGADDALTGSPQNPTSPGQATDGSEGPAPPPTPTPTPTEVAVDPGAAFNRGVTEGDTSAVLPGDQVVKSAPPPPTRVAGGNVAARDLGRLLELDPGRIDPATTTPRDLEALLERLRRADAELERVAEDLRARARDLERPGATD